MKKQTEPLGDKSITTLDEMLVAKYGERGALKREEWEQGFETFRLGVLIEEARMKLGMTPRGTADKCDTY